MAMTKALPVCLYSVTWLLLLSFPAGGPGLVYNEQTYNLLPPILKELADRPGWREGAPGPQATFIKYMKRLYKMSATKEGVPKVHKSPDYNTVRLFTPRTECKPRSKMEIKGDDMDSLDLSFNVNRVSALEHLLQSVLLYSVRKRFSSSNISCTCNLEILDQELSSPSCPHAPLSFEFQLQKRQRWVEIDVTSFLQPFISYHRQKIHIALNFTCTKNNQQYSFAPAEPFKIARSPPSLLLYLNDTSHKAYHRKNVLDRLEPQAWYERDRILSNLFDFEENVQVQQASRQRRDHDYEAILEESTTAVSHSYNFSAYLKNILHSQNECELHRFRLNFSQLNWDKWILAPHRYSPDYCKGMCPRIVGHRYGSPIHTIVQNIIYEKLDSSIPRPSCIPSEYRPMSVLTIEPDNSIAYKEYQDMIATKCTCR
ncbi:growth/differentiation factor 9 [Rhinophrynus dorsalis]